MGLSSEEKKRGREEFYTTVEFSRRQLEVLDLTPNSNFDLSNENSSAALRHVGSAI
jgi:hypothetical protein